MSQPWEVLEGDVRQVLRGLSEQSFDGCLSDPPYGIKFLGQRWDYSVPTVNVFVEVLRCLRPGAYAMFFGGTKTFHRLAVNVEDAGFIPRDVCAWLYGSGMSKGSTLDKRIDRMKDTRDQVLQITRWVKRARDEAGLSNQQIDQHFGKVGMAGHWTSTKSQPLVPTAEQWPELLRLLGREPPPEVAEVADRIIRGKGVPGDAWFRREKVGSRKGLKGSYNPGMSRHEVERDVTLPAQQVSAHWAGIGSTLKPCWEPLLLVQRLPQGTLAENALQHGVGGLAIDACRVGTTKDVPASTSTKGVHGWGTGSFDNPGKDPMVGRLPANVVMDEEAGALLDRQAGNRPGMSGGGKHRPGYGGGMFGGIDSTGTARGDDGGPSRFYYCPKVSRDERNVGGGDPNLHPTLKPVDLCRYFARLILPPPRLDGKPRRILVPYSGSGSEMLGCLLAGWDEVVGIELSPVHAETARRRIARGYAKLAARAALRRA